MSCDMKQQIITDGKKQFDTNRSDITEKLAQLSMTIETEMEKVCANYLKGPDRLVEAMRYSLLAGGKRIRPALVLLTNELCKGDYQYAIIPAIAIEMIHTFSLIHDDLPAMDDDDYRRGRLTNHKVFGEAIAILAGDALLAYAFELIAKHYPGDSETKVALIAELAQATGLAGMTGGQVLDMLFAETVETTKTMNTATADEHQLAKSRIAQAEEIHMLKTAALIECACRMGAISASADKEQLDALSMYGKNIGLAFQIVDDLLDQTQTQESLGKKAGKDRQSGKPNYAVLTNNIELARQRANNLISQAKQALETFGKDAFRLNQLADLILQRKS